MEHSKAMQPKFSLDFNSPDGEIANLLARREHGERWDGLTAEEMLAAYDRWRALIDLDSEGHANAQQPALSLKHAQNGSARFRMR